MPAIELPGTDSTGTLYTWNDNLAVDGTISVATATPTVDPTPTDIVFSIAGGALDLQWPSSHTGWTLQTNSVGLNAVDAWFDFPPETGSRETNRVILTIDPNNTNVFYRLTYRHGN